MVKVIDWNPHIQGIGDLYLTDILPSQWLLIVYLHIKDHSVYIFNIFFLRTEIRDTKSGGIYISIMAALIYDNKFLLYVSFIDIKFYRYDSTEILVWVFWFQIFLMKFSFIALIVCNCYQISAESGWFWWRTSFKKRCLKILLSRLDEQWSWYHVS